MAWTMTGEIVICIWNRYHANFQIGHSNELPFEYNACYYNITKRLVFVDVSNYYSALWLLLLLLLCRCRCEYFCPNVRGLISKRVLDLHLVGMHIKTWFCILCNAIYFHTIYSYNPIFYFKLFGIHKSYIFLHLQ